MNTNEQKAQEFLDLLRPVQHRLSAYCRIVTGSEDKALDLIQDTLTSAFESFHTLRDPASFQFFLIAIARNSWLKQKRRWKFTGKYSGKSVSDKEASSDSVDIQHDIRLLHKCISSLNTEQREAILMFHIMGFSIKEVAENEALSEAAVKNRLMRGREKLRKLISDKESRLMNTISANNL